MKKQTTRQFAAAVKNYAAKKLNTIIGFIAFSVLVLSVPSCKKPAENAGDLSGQNTANRLGTLSGTPDYNVTVSYNNQLGAISGNIFGLNAVYNNEKDVNWQAGAGVIPTKIDDLLPKQLRWPGGTVTTFYHWTRTSGVQGHADSWDPAYNPANDTPPANFMSVDEYLADAAAIGAEPLIGINMGSGMRFPSHSPSGLQEAKDLVAHVLTVNPNAKYFFLDNEPYQGDANYTYTATTYAQTVHTYASALKSLHPGIKLIANSFPNPADLDDANGWTAKLMSIAGNDINYIDWHFYWNYNNATFANWTSQAAMLNQGAITYKAQIAKFKTKYPSTSIGIVVLEWNIGPNVTTPGTYPTQAQAALMVAEQFMQLIQAGSPMTCLWPTNWGGNPTWNNRTLLDESSSFATTKMYDMFKTFYTVLAFRMKVSSTVSAISGVDPVRLANLAVKTNDGTKLYIYLVNKNQNTATSVVDINVQNFAFTGKSNLSFVSTDNTSGALVTTAIPFETAATNHVKLTLPKNSFVRITLSK